MIPQQNDTFNFNFRNNSIRENDTFSKMILFEDLWQKVGNNEVSLPIVTVKTQHCFSCLVDRFIRENDTFSKMILFTLYSDRTPKSTSTKIKNLRRRRAKFAIRHYHHPLKSSTTVILSILVLRHPFSCVPRVSFANRVTRRKREIVKQNTRNVFLH